MNMNTKAVKLALLKMNSEEVKSPRTLNSHNTPQFTKNCSDSYKKQLIILNAVKMNNTNAYKLHYSNNNLESKKIISHKSESRNNKLANNVPIPTSFSECNYKSYFNSNNMIISPTNNTLQPRNISNDVINYTSKCNQGLFPPTKFKKLNQESNNSENHHINPERLKTPKTATYKKSRHFESTQSKVSESIEVMSLLCNQNYVPLSPSTLQMYFPNYESTKCSTKQIMHIKGYAANTNQGIIR